MALIDNPNLAEILQFVREHEKDDPVQLLLSKKIPEHLPAKFIAEQIGSRAKSKNKLPELYRKEGILFPPLLSMEQCSSEATALFKASLMEGDSLVDLTAGFGIDCYYLSTQFKEVNYVEQSETLCKIAQHNFHQVTDRQHIKIHQDKAEDYIASADKFDTIYLDPARRDEANNKVFRWEDCQPNLVSLLPLLLQKSPTVWVKASPMIDISMACADLDQRVKEVYVVEFQGEVKELLFHLSSKKEDYPSIHAVQIKSDGTVEKSFSGNQKQEESQSLIVDTSRNYLYEPSPAMMKSGLFKSLASAYQLKALHANTKLFSSEELHLNFPGKVYEIKAVENAQKKSIAKHLHHKKANLKVRNFPSSVESLKKKLAIQDGGRHFLFAVTLFDESKKVLICEKVEH